MKDPIQPMLVPTDELASWFRSKQIAFTTEGSLDLGFGTGNKQYRLYSYPGPADHETMGVFCEWHTGDFFEVDTGPHFAIGMRGPVADDPHRGRGPAIGILANSVPNPEDPDNPVQLFKGCPDFPGGPSFFIEDFTINDGNTPIKDWQLSLGQDLPQLQGNGIYRIDAHVSRDHVWAAVWKVTMKPSADGKTERSYTFLGQTECSVESREHPQDRGRGNVFIGQAFADPETKSWVDNIHIAHW